MTRFRNLIDRIESCDFCLIALAGLIALASVVAADHAWITIVTLP